MCVPTHYLESRERKKEMPRRPSSLPAVSSRFSRHIIGIDISRVCAHTEEAAHNAQRVPPHHWDRDPIPSKLQRRTKSLLPYHWVRNPIRDPTPRRSPTTRKEFTAVSSRFSRHIIEMSHQGGRMQRAKSRCTLPRS